MYVLRTIVTLIIVVTIIFVGIYYNELRGYRKIERINEWVLYECYSCVDEDEEDVLYPGFYLVNGFEEMSVDEALKSDFFDEETENQIINYIHILEHENDN